MSQWYSMNRGFTNDHNSSELSLDTTGLLDCIFSNNLSPISGSVVPRKLDFNDIDDENVLKDAEPAPTSLSSTYTASLSPPYKRVRALRLCDSPHTPKTILEKSSTPSHRPARVTLFPSFLPETEMPSASNQHDDSANGSLDDSRSHARPSLANINPFTPDGQALNRKKRALSKTPTDRQRGDDTPQQPAKRLRESNISRYNIEFIELSVIGCGHFGRVTKCLNKLDGCVYAVKRSLRPLAGSVAERAALKEVFAHAALGKHPHVVRYYSAWAEDNHMVIQSEYCDGGSLQQLIEEEPLREPELLLLLSHIADGLAYIHSQHIVHMDVKPGNIFVCNGDSSALSLATNEPPSDDEYEDDEPPPLRKYKIGDLGHVTLTTALRVDEEGDCRYLAKEVLENNLKHLAKADIFAFGLTLYEAGGGGPLPKNGEEWHSIRNGNLPDLPNVSRGFNELLKKMVDPDPRMRPSASQLRRHPLAETGGNKTKAQLRRELAAAKMKADLLAKQLEDATRYIKSLTPNVNQDGIEYRTRSKRQQKNTSLSKSDHQSLSVSPIRIERRTKRVVKKDMYYVDKKV